MPETVEKVNKTQLKREHKEAVELRESASTAGVKAAATKRIREVEAQMQEHEVDFTAYVIPGSGSAGNGVDVTALSDSALLDYHRTVVELRESADSAGVKAAARIKIKAVESELESRSVEFEAYSPSQPAVEQVSDEDLLASYHALNAEYEGTQSAGRKAAITRRQNLVMAECASRGIDPVPAEDSEESGS